MRGSHLVIFIFVLIFTRKTHALSKNAYLKTLHLVCEWEIPRFANVNGTSSLVGGGWSSKKPINLQLEIGIPEIIVPKIHNSSDQYLSMPFDSL